MIITAGLVERFRAKVSVGAPDDCWPWTATINTRGYGTVSGGAANGHRPVYAHRLAYALTHGEWPPHVRHTCDTPGCCNPAHMLPGTPRQNTQDAIDRGRLARGERVRGRKLTTAQVDEIRAMYPNGARRGRPLEGQMTYGQLALRYGVHPESIGAVVRRAAYATPS